MADQNKMFERVEDLMKNADTLDPEVYAAELKKFSALERRNAQCVEYISEIWYPAGKFDRGNFLLTLKVNGRIYYPIVGWDPDAIHPLSKETRVPPFRKWLNKLPKKKLHNPTENRTYILYG